MAGFSHHHLLTGMCTSSGTLFHAQESRTNVTYSRFGLLGKALGICFVLVVFRLSVQLDAVKIVNSLTNKKQTT